MQMAKFCTAAAKSSGEVYADPAGGLTSLSLTTTDTITDCQKEKNTIDLMMTNFARGCEKGRGRRGRRKGEEAGRNRRKGRRATHR